jgi:ABC-type lipoprotein release transport system permease subunit
MISAIAVGICAGVFSAAFYKGMLVQRMEKVINTEISHLQIHHPNFRQSNDINEYIEGSTDLANRIREIPEIDGVSERLVVYSMIASAETGAGVRIQGVDPKYERMTTNLHEKVVDGNYFEEDRRNPVLIGHKLAEKLKVRLGSKVVITLQDLENNITAGAFRVVGIFNSVNNAYDEANVFVRFNDLARLMNMPENAAHEIAVYTNNFEKVDQLKNQISALSKKEEVMTWKEISPEMNYYTEFMDFYMYIFIVIILFALLFGIINTMLMAVMERAKEIGMLMAVGMNKLRVFNMIMFETVLLSLTGGAVGVFIGYLISKYFETRAIDLSLWGQAYQDLGYDPFVYTIIESKWLIIIPILVIITGIIASIYPAIKALSNDPAEALRIE